jgi:hypothetical protein
MRIWHGRHAGPLVTAWLVALALVAGLKYGEHVQPALGDLFVPIYTIIVAAAIFVTWRWFRARSGLRADDRRHFDRRRLDRRDHPTPGS